MHYCRYCQKPTVTDSGSCPHCGEELSAAAEKFATQSTQLASLDVETADRQIDPATGEVMTGSTSSAREVDLVPEGGDAPIELGFDPLAERVVKQRTQPATPDALERRAAEKAGSPAAPAATAAVAAGPGPDEVARVSGYGSPPSGFFQALPYMLHVRKHRTILRDKIADIQKQLGSIKEALDKELLDVGHRKLTECEKDPGPYSRDLEHIQESRRLVDQFRSERAIEEQDMKGKESYVDEEITRLQLEADKFKSEQEVLNAEAEDSYAARKRIQLRIQRVDIEIRNVKEQIPKPGKGEPLPNPAIVMPLESKIAGLKEVRGHIKGELETADEGIKEINRKLAMARNKVSEHMGKAALANKKKSELLHVRKASDEVSQSRFYELQGKYEENIRELARKALREDRLPSESDEKKRAIEEKIASVESIESNLELHKTAIESFSRQDFVRGHIILGGIGFLAFVLILLVLAIVF